MASVVDILLRTKQYFSLHRKLWYIARGLLYRDSTILSVNIRLVFRYNMTLKTVVSMTSELGVMPNKHLLERNKTNEKRWVGLHGSRRVGLKIWHISLF